MIATTAPPIYTAQEYLELEVAAADRHEYINGEIILMTGGSPNHNEIAGGFYAMLRSALKNRPYRSFITDQRLWIPQSNHYTYPDVMVVATPLELQAGRTDTIMNPLLIAEVFSKGTRSYDKDKKFTAYRSIPSFQEYLLIDQYSPTVEQYTKVDDDQWLFREYKNLTDKIVLKSLPVEITIADLYEGIEF